MKKPNRFRFTKEQYSEIKRSIEDGSFFSCSPAIERELSEVRIVGEKNYPWREK